MLEREFSAWPEPSLEQRHPAAALQPGTILPCGYR
jgi:hypothetical protein